METPISLLNRVRLRSSDSDWHEFCTIYYPLVLSWCRKSCGRYHEALDLVQEIFIDVHRNIGNFERRASGSLRGWLRRILYSRLSNMRAKRFPELVDFDELHELLAISHSGACDRIRYPEMFLAACAKVRPEFTETSWVAFERTFLANEDIHLVSQNLGISRNAVYVARSRIVRRLKDCLVENLI